MFLMLISIMGTVSAANYTVNPGDSIQSAIDNASSNDTIIVNDNNGSAYTYTENLVINKTLQLKASTGKNVTIRPSNLSSIVTINQGMTVTISNLKFANGYYASNQGGAIYNAGNLTLINCTFTNNTAYNGGAICNGGNLTVMNSTFINNTAIHDGGAINSVNSLTVNNCVFTNNVAQHVCGAIINWQGTMNVTGSGFTGNTAAMEGSTIGNYYGTANINYNRIITSGNYGLYNANGGTVNATNNWWGSNADPTTNSSNIYNRGGTINYTPWLMLNVTANPTSTNNNSTITADLTHNSAGNDTSSQGHIPDNIPVNFTTTLGTVTSSVNTRNGKASAIFSRGTATSGTTTVTAAVDGQTVQTRVIIGNILNINKGNVYSSIQDAVNGASAGDVIQVRNGSYTENIVINAPLTLESFPGETVTIQSLNPSSPLITVNSGGSGSLIQGFTLIGVASSDDIYLNYTTNCTIKWNNMINGWNGVDLNYANNNLVIGNTMNNIAATGIFDWYSNYNTFTGNIINNTVHGGLKLQNSNNNIVTGNTFTNNPQGLWIDHANNNIATGNTATNNQYGIYFFYGGSNNTVSGNTVTNNTNYGIWIYSSNNNNIIGNTVTNNCYGVYISSSSVNVNFNRIAENSVYGLYNAGSGTVNATNNWWGSNNPIVSSTTPNDIYISGGTVTYNPWLVLSTTANPTSTNGNSTVTADLTHNNQGNDTSSQGHIPDNIPVNFTTTVGTVTSSVNTRNGKASATFSRGTATNGVANITATFDRQSLQTNVTIRTDMAPVVAANLSGGVYNSDKNVTLIATDDYDLHPVIFYSLDNGTTWNNQTNNVTLSLFQGKWGLSYYAVDSAGNSALIQNVTYVIDETAPIVWSNLNTGLYNTSQAVNLTVSDNLDSNPVIYYTINGSTPTTSSTMYTNPINITGTTTLKFMAVDSAGNQANATTEYYIFAPIGNINTGKGYSSIQAAINDPLTLDGHTIEVSNGTYTENVVVNKNLNIITAPDSNVIVHASNSSNPVFTINSGGSGSLIQGFVISGAVSSFGIYLVGCSNCTINNNTITNNCIGVGTSSTKTENNTIMYDNITSNQVGLATLNSYNYVIDDNTITYNSNYGIELLNSNNTAVYTNLVMENNSPGNYTSGIYISNSNNTVIQNNLIPGNMFGLDIEYCGNCTVNGNLITEGMVGILTYYSSTNINFNSITANSEYGLYNLYGNINATNNWWGSNTPINSTNICNVNGTVNTTSWLMLNINPTSLNSGGNASITADLTHNNLGQDTSSQGHVIDGLIINFSKTSGSGTIISPAHTIKGQAVAILNLGTTTSQTVAVNASLDSQTVSRQMTITSGSAVLNITSSALNSTTLQPISLTYTLPLNSSVTWVSVLWKNTYVFYGELDVIVNGVVVKSTEYVNPGYNRWRNSGYRDDVFRAIIYANNYILQAGMNSNAIPTSFWNNLTSSFSLTSTELQFIKNHRLEFMDNLTVNLAYPGVAGQNITVADPENSTNVINLNFPGNTIHRTSQITYLNGFFIEPAGYEGVKSFAIATTDVTSNILTYWLNQNSTYPVGPMKAAYGTFLTALLVEYWHDNIADNLASGCNVTWSRTSPIVVSVGDDAYQTYLTLECDHGMGMTVVGKPDNMKLFNCVCSSAIPSIEYSVMNGLAFNFQARTTSGDLRSVKYELINMFLNGTSIEEFEQNGLIIMKAEGSDDNFWVIDPETGIVRDINTINNYCGAYCFPDLQTELANDLGNFLLNHQATLPGDIATGISIVGGISGVVSYLLGATAGVFAPSVAFMYGYGSWLLDVRTNEFPVEYWRYFNVHRSYFQGYELRTFMKDGIIYYQEIPKNQDGSLNWDEAVTYASSNTPYYIP